MAYSLEGGCLANVSGCSRKLPPVDEVWVAGNRNLRSPLSLRRLLEAGIQDPSRMQMTVTVLGILSYSRDNCQVYTVRVRPFR